MKGSEVSDALLDYWTARAESVPAGELEIITVMRSVQPSILRCIRNMHVCPYIDYSTNWAMTGPLVEKYHLMLESDMGRKWQVSMLLHNPDGGPYWGFDESESLRVAICRAVVRSVFGEEVPELALS